MAESKSGQGRLFYDDAYEALTHSIALSGKSLKEIASRVFPGASLDTAKSKLSRALSPDNTDVGLRLEIILTILDETTPEPFLDFLCDRYKRTRTEPIHELTPEERLSRLVSELKKRDLDKLFPELV